MSRVSDPAGRIDTDVSYLSWSGPIEGVRNVIFQDPSIVRVPPAPFLENRFSIDGSHQVRWPDFPDQIELGATSLKPLRARRAFDGGVSTQPRHRERSSTGCHSNGDDDD